MTNRMDIATTEPTRYEVALIAPDGAARLIAYTARHTQRGLMDAVMNRRDQVMDAIGSTETVITFVGKGARREWRLGTGHVIKFTGRTERTAASEGEYASI